MIGDSFNDFEAQMFSLLLWFHNGGLLELTATVDYDGSQESATHALAVRLGSNPAALRIGAVCNATRKVLFNLGLLYIESGKRGSWPEHIDRDLCLNAGQLQMCLQGQLFLPLVRVQGSLTPHYLLRDFGTFYKTVVFGLPLLKYESQRHLTDVERGTSTSRSDNTAGDGPLSPCRSGARRWV